MKQKEYQALHICLLLGIFYSILGIGVFIILGQQNLECFWLVKIIFALIVGFYLIFKVFKIKIIYKQLSK
jgi:hypothetical protein